MKDEEKAEEYVENKYHCNQSECIQGNSCDYCYREESKRAYIAGLAEGRKEGYEQGKNNERELQCGKKNYEKDNIRLEKENEGLKEQIEQLQQAYTITVDKSVIREQELEKENAELKEQVEQLSNDNHVLKTAFISQKEQIEKMVLREL